MFGHINHLVLKVTKDCNLRCEYCYVKNKDAHRGEVIKFETLQDIIKRVAFDRIKTQNKEKVNITLHGGEPTIIGKKNLYKFFDFITSYLTEKEIPFALSTQTNLTLVDKEIAEIFNQFDVQVGFSFDGFGSNDLRLKNSSDEFFTNKIQLLKDNNVKCGALFVVTTENYKDKKVNNSANKMKEMFDMRPKINYAEDIITDKTSESDNFEINGADFFGAYFKNEFEDFLSCKIDNLIDENSNKYLERFLNDMFLEYDSVNETGNCYMKWCGGGLRVIEVEPTGEIHYCGRYSEPFQASKIGTVWDEEFLDLKSYRRYIDMINIKSNLLKQYGCDSCRAKHICDYGCLAFHYSKFEKWGIREDLVCDYFKTMYDYFEKNKDRIIRRIFGKNKKIEIKVKGPVVKSLKKVGGFNTKFEKGKLTIEKRS